jgi:DNA modification methylase
LADQNDFYQLPLWDFIDDLTELDSRWWRGSFNGRESTLQQLSPYVGKMKSGMAHALIRLYSKPHDTILDPFSGSGVVPLEAALLNRVVMANDLSPYAYTLTRGKLDAPITESVAIQQCMKVIEIVESQAYSVDLTEVPEWIREFFHPKTLSEVLVAFRVLEESENYFLKSCLLGILHHVRPGFLSYPSSHLVPYLRKKKYPPDEYPKMYQYRDLRSRLLAKVRRAYRRSQLSPSWKQRQYRVWNTNAMHLDVPAEKVDTIISSPPYFGALDYARDNRLRLWFLGCEDWKKLDSELTANQKDYLPQMRKCLLEMERVLKSRGCCVLVLGDVDQNGRTRRTAELLAELAIEATRGGFQIETIYDDRIPDERRSRRKTSTTKFERILIMTKVS